MPQPCQALHGLLKAIVREYRRILGSSLAGIYLHGSAAFGCFRWQTSDIDLLVAVKAPPSALQKEALVRALLAQNGAAPPAGFEMSVVPARCCRQFVWPVPYELHFSNMHRASFEKDLPAACARMHGAQRPCRISPSRGPRASPVGGKCPHHVLRRAPPAHTKPPFCTMWAQLCRTPGKSLCMWC
ncbi:MAG: hypothetical protein ACLRPX_09635 [Ruthenibacterium sp.]